MKNRAGMDGLFNDRQIRCHYTVKVTRSSSWLNAPCIRFVLQEPKIQHASAALFPCNYKTYDIRLLLTFALQVIFVYRFAA